MKDYIKEDVAMFAQGAGSLVALRLLAHAFVGPEKERAPAAKMAAGAAAVAIASFLYRKHVLKAVTPSGV